jgi:hypothetical protein
MFVAALSPQRGHRERPQVAIGDRRHVQTATYSRKGRGESTMKPNPRARGSRGGRSTLLRLYHLTKLGWSTALLI